MPRRRPRAWDALAGRGQQVLVAGKASAGAATLGPILARAGYRVDHAGDAPAVVARTIWRPPDLLLLDNGLEGLAICRAVKADPARRTIPILLVADRAGLTDQIRGLEAGADEILPKPVDAAVLLLRVAALLRLKRQHDEVDRSHHLLMALALALDARDPFTRQHSRNVATLARGLALAAGLDEPAATRLEQAGLLHDLGKIAVPDAILSKPGPLDEAEWAVMRRHPLVGWAMCRHLPSLRHALAAIRHHHEAWDGSGYPDGLAGAAIPHGARIVAVADAYDALTSDRPYRPGHTPERALAILRAGAGRQWDPALVDAFDRLVRGEAGPAPLAMPWPDPLAELWQGAVATAPYRPGAYPAALAAGADTFE